MIHSDSYTRASQTAYVRPHLACFPDHNGSPGYWASLSPSDAAEGSQESWRSGPLSCIGKPFFWLQMECRRIPKGKGKIRSPRRPGTPVTHTSEGQREKLVQDKSVRKNEETKGADSPVATDTFKDSSPGGRGRLGRIVRSSWQEAKTSWDRPEPSLPAEHETVLGSPSQMSTCLEKTSANRKAGIAYLPSTRRVGRSQTNSRQLVMGTLEDWEISGPGHPTVPTTSHPCWALAWKKEENTTCWFTESSSELRSGRTPALHRHVH